VITGRRDADRPAARHSSGLIEAQHILRGVRGLGCTYFTAADVVRHPLVARIVEATRQPRRLAKAANRRAAGVPASADERAAARRPGALAVNGLPARATLAAGSGCARARRRDHAALRASRRGASAERDYRGKDYATNVLTFGYTRAPAVHADIVLCVR